MTFFNRTGRHFLAQGKRVLVTSHTTKALSVLKEKVPLGLQNLCVSVTDDSRGDMEKSVDGISDYLSRTTSARLKEEMDELARVRKDIIRQLASARKRLYAVIQAERGCLVYQGEEISPSDAAKFVRSHADSLSYIPGQVRVPAPLPLSMEELRDLYRSNGDLSVEYEQELERDLPNPKTLMTPTEFEPETALKRQFRKRAGALRTGRENAGFPLPAVLESLIFPIRRRKACGR